MDDKTKKAPQDASRVNIHEPYEVSYWTSKFGCTAEQLKSAVQRAGASATAVEAALKQR